MKKLVLLFLLISAGLQMRAQNQLTASGYVNDLVGGVANHMVYLRIDSVPTATGFILDSVLTNQNGYFSFTINLPPAIGIIFGDLYTFDCNNYLINHPYFFQTPNPNVFHNFMYCNSGTSCNADFVFLTNPSGAPTNSVAFSSLSQPRSSNHIWIFGDGSIDTLNNTNIVKTYNSAGTYQVCLVLSDTNCVDTICKTITINPISCQANFVPYIDSINPNQIYFTNTSPGYNAASTFNWSFGDGTTSTAVNPVKTYANSGTYTVILVRTEANNCIDTFITNVVVGSPVGCTANFFHLPAIITIPNAINFVSNSQPIFAWHIWDFGDGQFDTTNNNQITHVYQQPGTYNVCLIIISSSCSDTICQTLVVGSTGFNCLASFQSVADSINPSQIYFNNTSQGYNAASTFNWSFGDGTTSTAVNPVKTYANAGTYVVHLVRIEANCIDSFTNTIIVLSGSSQPWFRGAVSISNTSIGMHPFAVYLFFQDTLTGQISPVDTFYSGASILNPVYNYEFNGNYQPGVYILLAELLQGHNMYSSYMPTYFGNTTTWSSASTIFASGPTNNFLNIDLQEVSTNWGGTAMLAGNVWNGPPSIGTLFGFQKARVLVSNNQNTLVAHTITDASGRFMVPNLAFGTYLVWVEMPGKFSDQAEITLNGNTPSFDSIQFYVQTTGILLNTTLANQIAGLKVYPNPTTDYVFVELDCANINTLQITVFDAAGKLLETKLVTNNTCNSLNQLNIEHLHAGVYFIKVQANNNIANLKLIKY